MEVFNDNSLINLSNSILKHFGVETFHSTIPEIDSALEGHKKVVVVLFDGMGKNIIRYHLKEKSFIRSHYLLTINSTFPPTTAAATTSFLTGKYPVETGWLGWTTYFKDYNRNIILFRGIDYNTGEKLNKEGEINIADRYYPNKKIYELISEAKNDAKGLAIQRYPVQKDGPKTLLISGAKKLKKALKENKECFIYSYWDSPDYEMHAYGIHHPIVHYQVKKAEAFLKKVTRQNKDTLFISIADHGHINVKFFDICDHPDIYSLIDKPLGLEKRAVSFFIKKGKDEEFKTLFKKYYGEYFELISKEDAFKIKLFGLGEIRDGVLDSIGEYIAISKSEYCLYASKELKHFDFFKGHHAGGTVEEREIDVSIYNR